MASERPTTPASTRVEAGLSRAMLAHQLRFLFGQAGGDGFGCVIDVGAHHGQSAQMLRELGHRGTIVSLEPHPESYARLEAESASDPDWRVRRLALGSRTGPADLLGRSGTDLSSLLPNSDYGEGFEQMRPDPEPIAIELARLDDVYEELLAGAGQGPVLLKVDVQGTELDVLEGARSALEGIAAVQVELAVNSLYRRTAPWHAPIDLLERGGFEISGLVPVGRDRHGRLVDVDCLLVRRSLPAR